MFSALWPIFHYLLWQDVSPTSLSGCFSADEHWAPYEQVNTSFARKIMDIYRPGDLIIVHDYHLLLVPKLLRLLVPDVYVGLFVHTPWPSSEVFRCLPRMFANRSMINLCSNFSRHRSKGNLGWHAGRKPCMFPDLFLFPALYVILCTSLWI
jgi:hypothetical protein